MGVRQGLVKMPGERPRDVASGEQPMPGFRVEMESPRSGVNIER